MLIDNSSCDIENDKDRSFGAVSSLVFIEIARLRALDCNYEEALWGFSSALTTLFYSNELALDDRYVPEIDVAPQEIVNVFEGLRDSTTGTGWSDVATYCYCLGTVWAECFGDDPSDLVQDSNGELWEWRAYWASAQGWAKARLQPSEFLEQMKRSEDEQARQRLVTYFFEESLWAVLSDRATRSLVDAEKAWFSSKWGRVEGIANELRIATEEVLCSLVWDPLCRWTDTRATKTLQLLEFQNIREEQSKRRKAPTLAVLKQVLRTEALRRFLIEESFPKEDQRFLREELPEHLRRLRIRRSAAEHDIGRSWHRGDVAPLFRIFLGVGCEGVLPRLARMLADAAKRAPATDISRSQALQNRKLKEQQS